MVKLFKKSPRLYWNLRVESFQELNALRVPSSFLLLPEMVHIMASAHKELDCFLSRPDTA